MFLNIRQMQQTDIEKVAHIHSQVFARQLASKKWITCNFNAYPRIMMYVAVDDTNEVIGYIQWLQKSGFRKETVLELEQIAVLPTLQGKGIGTQLILKSLEQVKNYLKLQNSSLKAVIVTTRTDNAAQHLYKNTLGASVAGVIKNLYSHDEVIMLARYS